MKNRKLNSINIRLFSEEVLFSDERILGLGEGDMAALIERAIVNNRKTIRLCAHKHIDDKLHEMMIVHGKNAYVMPHKHINKQVSFHVIAGNAALIIFNDDGNIVKVIEMGDYGKTGRFYCRVEENLYYAQFVRTEFFVFHEVTSGPFVKSDTIWAPWAPQQKDMEKGRIFLEQKLFSYLTLH